jgi:NhaA family Na+:H+ antiporter
MSLPDNLDWEEPMREKIRKWTADGQFFYPWERQFEKLVTPFEEFIHKQTTSGIILLSVTFIALIIENSPLREAYEHLIHTNFSLTIGSFILERSLAHWINEGLMTFFFFVVGLEIKREILVGELTSLKHAALPIVAAVGGMVVPALVYTACNVSGAYSHGWGIPMATDIAFCVSALVVLGRRIPQSLTMFLVALAIVDDLGAVLVIAVFYTSTINLSAIGVAAGMLFLLVLFNLLGIRKSIPYFFGGIIMWVALFYSGIHATIAGILVAFCIPARARYKPGLFSERVAELMGKFSAANRPGETMLTNMQQYSVLKGLDEELHLAEPPLQRMEGTLHLPVALIVIPLFALANAAIPLDLEHFSTTLLQSVSLGIILGLVAGKFIGITLFSWLVVKSGIAVLPQGVDMRHVAGVGLLGGIGFTMSIFIAELSFSSNYEMLVTAKTAIIVASFFSGVLGYCWLRFFSAR